MRLADVLAGWTPGDGWTWDEEEADLHQHPCRCTDDPRTVSASSEPTCPVPGHYQKNLEAWLATRGRIEQPVCLGPDGRVWDGHHRIVAARRLGFTEIPVED